MNWLPNLSGLGFLYLQTGHLFPALRGQLPELSSAAQPGFPEQGRSRDGCQLDSDVCAFLAELRFPYMGLQPKLCSASTVKPWSPQDRKRLKGS